jgi:uncharacterized protein YfaT (DUF1175 family)
MTALFERMCRQCEKTEKRGAQKQMGIDAARELVQADDEYKSKSNFVKAFFFAHPHARDASIFVGGAVTYAFGSWLFS